MSDLLCNGIEIPGEPRCAHLLFREQDESLAMFLMKMMYKMQAFSVHDESKIQL